MKERVNADQNQYLLLKLLSLFDAAPKFLTLVGKAGILLSSNPGNDYSRTPDPRSGFRFILPM